MGLVAAAYTLRSGVPLDFTFTGWVEATKAWSATSSEGLPISRRAISAANDAGRGRPTRDVPPKRRSARAPARYAREGRDSESGVVVEVGGQGAPQVPDPRWESFDGYSL
jgi:hypothetical protein